MQKKIISQLISNIKSLRVRADLTQEQVAKNLNISRARFSEIENTPNKIKIELLIKLARIYDCKLSDFFVDVD